MAKKPAQGKKEKKKQAKVLLVHFLSDALKRKKLQREIIKDAHGSMKAYGLSKRQIDTVKSGSHRKIADAIAAELGGVPKIPSYPIDD